MKTPPDSETWMRRALEEAREGGRADEVPVGAVVVGPDGALLGAAHDERLRLKDPTAHAEILALRQAAKASGDWRLEDCDLYVTLEPCPMCAGAIILSRIVEVYYAADDPKAGCCGTLMNLLEDSRFNHQPKVIPGLMAEECGELLKTFFRQIRQDSRSNLN